MWRATAESRGLQLKFMANAAEALRLAQTSAVALWVVNTALPGLSGFDLCGMLRSQSARVPVFLVAEEYSVEAEQAAWSARASMFGCKSQHEHWLEEWALARFIRPPGRMTQASAGRQISPANTAVFEGRADS